MDTINKETTISVRLTAKEAQAIKKLAKSNSLRVSEFLRNILKKVIKNEREENI
jgi:predicted DNA binding CopG/RHH family protein